LIFDPNYKEPISPKDIKSKHPELNPYMGMVLQGRVEQTYLKGRKIWDVEKGIESFHKNTGRVLKQITCGNIHELKHQYAEDN
jgi:hypothetical protein